LPPSAREGWARSTARTIPGWRATSRSRSPASVTRRHAARPADARRPDHQHLDHSARREPDAATDFSDNPVLIIRRIDWSADSTAIYAALAERNADIILLDGVI